jgi:alpha-galactosidase
LDGLLSHNDIAFIKWDYNRNWSEPGWPEVAADREKNVYVDYTVNLYSILRELRAKHPNVEIESCSGGGGRVDLGILGLADQIWTSDNTDPFERLSIQDGFTQAYSPAAMMTWVTGPTNRFTKRTTSLNYRFLSAMQGSLGIGADVRTFTPQEMAAAKDYVATYKQLRETIQHGSLYRLISPQQQSSYSVTESVSMDRKQAVVFTFLHSSEELYPFPTVRLEGLDPDTTYALKPIYGARMRDTPQSASGRYWMEKGITPLLAGDFQAAAFQFNAVAQ